MRILRIILPFALMISILAACSKNHHYHNEPAGQTIIRTGALLSISGSGASTGESSRVSIGLAQQDINAWLGSLNRNVIIQTVIADTKTDTAEALKQLKIFYDQGIRLIIGPYSSAEVAAIKSFADTHGMLIVSPSSVAVSLAIPGDNIFRFVSCDVIQGQAMTRMLTGDSIRAIVPLIRNDVWGRDLVGSTGSEFIKNGGMVSDPVKYDPSKPDFSADLALADAAVGTLLGSYKADEVAVYLCCFGEGVKILASAGNYQHLKAVAWYGSSAFAQNASITTDTAASRFASSHLLPNPIYGLDESAQYKWQPLKQRIQSSTGHDADIYALTAYDAVWVSAKTYLTTGTSPDIATLKSAFMQEASNYFGASGNTTLDDNGDRAYGNYDFWEVTQIPQGFLWQITARYNSATGTLIRVK